MSIGMSDEKQAFSARLKAAMEAAGHPPRPVVLEKLFNSHYWGRSVTFQAASRWLGGRSIPSQEKLQVLADLFAVEPQALRYGEEAVKHIRDKRSRWDSGMTMQDREIVEALLGLTVEQKKTVQAVILAFANAGKG